MTYNHTTGSAALRFLTLLFFVCSTYLTGSVSVMRSAQAKPITVTDMLDRQVTLQKPAERIVLPEGRHVLTLALLGEEPVSRLVGWGTDLKRYAPAAYETVSEAFPFLAELPDVGGVNGNDISYETVIAANPDLVLFTLYGPPPSGLEKLDAAGIAYAFVDFFQEPLNKTVPSMRMLGELLGKEAEAEKFIDFYQEHMDGVSRRLEGITNQPDVLFHLNPDGKSCCFSSGPGNMSDFIAAAGGHNIGADRIPGAIGQISLEYILSRDPDFYLAGGGSTVSANGLAIGSVVTPETSHETLARIVATPGLSSLSAIKNDRAAGIWLFFFDNPLFVVGVEAMGKMFHPEAFKDVYPARTMEVLNSDFYPFDLTGTFWISLEEKEE